MILKILALVLVVLFGVVIALRSLGFLQFLELGAYDLLVTMGVRDSKVASPISLIEITEADIRQLGNWPLNDSQLAQALTKVLHLPTYQQ